MSDRAEPMSQVTAVAGIPSALYALVLTAHESDSLSATGQIIRVDHAPDGDTECSLNTNDSLSDLWASPEGNLWVASANGHVWTTAEVSFSQPLQNGFQFENHDPVLAWRGTTLPKLRGIVPNPTRIFGTSDQAVRVSTFKGPDLRWTGKSWEECDPEDAPDVRSAEFQQRRLVAAGPRGVLEQVGDELRPFKESLPCVRLCTYDGRLFVIEPTQQEPSIVQYDPAADPDWTRLPL